SRSFDENNEAGGVHIPTSFQIVGLYSEVEVAPTDWLTVMSGARLDVHSLFASRVSPRLGLLFHQRDDYGVKLLFAQGVRNPSPIEAFFADGMQFIANENLSPETMTSFEGVVWARPIAGLNVRAGGFAWLGRDLLELTPVAGDKLQFQNISDENSIGAEVEAA